MKSLSVIGGGATGSAFVFSGVTKTVLVVLSAILRVVTDIRWMNIEVGNDRVLDVKTWGCTKENRES